MGGAGGVVYVRWARLCGDGLVAGWLVDVIRDHFPRCRGWASGEWPGEL